MERSECATATEWIPETLEREKGNQRVGSGWAGAAWWGVAGSGVVLLC